MLSLRKEDYHMKKKIIITVDTEGDLQWDWKKGDIITTRNSKYLQRFQTLCNHYGFIPVWLTNWEMLNDDAFVEFVKENISNHCSEVGMHLHAWSNPPYYGLKGSNKSGQPYLIEYPFDIMEKKIKAITEMFKERFGFVPDCHRAGRWAINKEYFMLLKKYGYKIDCSITPELVWHPCYGGTPGFMGPDYRKKSHQPYFEEGILEIPMTSKRLHSIKKPKNVNQMIKSIYHGIKGQNTMFRPDKDNLTELKMMMRETYESESDYLMFMIHSSELMPGGSPNFPEKKDIEQLYMNLTVLFEEASTLFDGIALGEYGKNIMTQRLSI